MSIHRIRLIAALCAIAAFAGSTAVRANQDTAKTGSNPHHSANAEWSSDKMSDPAKASGHAYGHSKVMAASEHANAKKFDELKGKAITGTKGEKLGDLHDFIIDAQSGKIAHAVVSSGGMLGIGDKMRVVAHDSLKAGADGLSVQMDKSAFEALPTIDQQDLKAGKVTAKAQTSQQSSTWTGQQGGAATSTDASPKASSSDIASTNAPDATDDSAATASASATAPSSVTASTDSSTSLSSPTDTATTPGSTPAATDTASVASTTTQPSDTSATTSTSSDATASMHASGNFVRASELDGKELRSGGEEIGTIEDVAIDLEQGTAMAVVKMKSDNAGGDELFHVPFSNLQVDSANAQSISTTLARTDFMSSSSSSQASTASTTSTSDESLSPTGRSTDNYGATASTSTSSATKSADNDTAANDATRDSATGAGSTYSSSVGSTSTTSTDPVAASTQTTEPYAATAGPSTSSTASSTTASDLAGSTTSDSTVSGLGRTPSSSSTAVSTPGSSISGDNTTNVNAGIAGTSNTETKTAEDEQLTPTGRNSVSAHQDLGTAAAAIRSALNSDQTLASEDVRVQEAGKKIMLQGKVSSEDVKERIETLAKQAAGSAEIDNKLKVKDQR